jgi:hypothetical protein
LKGIFHVILWRYRSEEMRRMDGGRKKLREEEGQLQFSLIDLIMGLWKRLLQGVSSV